MNIKEFNQKYLNLISEFEKEIGRRAIWRNYFTKAFLDWLQQRNIKITFKYHYFINFRNRRH